MPFTSSGTVFGNYARPANTYDELWDDAGQIRTDWSSLFYSLNSLGKKELLNRHSEIQRLLRENGVTYNVYGDPAGLYRLWKLDAVPFVISAKEWEFIETGLIQRAKLLNHILSDIYGKRELIKKGYLPLDLIYNHSGFLRPCDGIKLPGHNQLFIYAVDLVRDKDGKLWALNDRTQAPSGSGYALENRSVISRVMPEIFYNYKVRKLNGFFNTLHNSLVSIAPNGIQNPRIVILTPGPDNETYFEHAYLSAYLGYNLVQGEDLTVRDGFVWLKTIQGLERVDIILRRVDDSFCDPLELIPYSRLGVSGLTEAVRRGNVVVANPLGSSILENPGLTAFLPSLSKYFFNEELMLPSLNTWWCGQPAELNYVLENINSLRIKIIHRHNASRTISHGNLDQRQADALKKTIMAKPSLYVAHEKLNVSTIPSFIDGDLDRRFAVLRCFLVAKDDTYVVMPGGLTRSSAERDAFRVSNQYGGISKDTWVLGRNDDNVSGAIFLPSAPDTKDNSALPSRSAENMYWAGRYSIRAKTIARFIVEVYNKIEQNSAPGSSEKQTLNILLTCLTHVTMIYPGFTGEEAEEKFNYPHEELLSIILSQENSGTLASSIQFFKRAIFAVRNRWPSDAWHIVDDIEENWKKLEYAKVKNIRLIKRTMESVNDSLTNFIGINLESIPRDHAYILFNIGRRIEKAQLLIYQLKFAFSKPEKEQVEYYLMEALLSCNMSLTIYRLRFRSYLQLEAFLDLLLFDVTNPSSLLYQVEQLKNYFSQLQGKKTTGSRLGKEEKLILEAYTLLQNADVARLKLPEQLGQNQTQSQGDEKSGQKQSQGEEKIGERKELTDLLTNISQLLFGSSDALIAEYFTHTESSQQL